jgi:hypothetical protein
MDDKRIACRISARKPGGKRPLGGTRRRSEHNIKILREIGWVGIDGIDLEKDR